MIHWNKQWSLWRRWDLHVHTKDTNKNDQFTSVDFHAFCITMFQKAIENRICAIWITDYFSVDNYFKVKEFVVNIEHIQEFNAEEKLYIKNILLLPNVELRMLPVTDTGSLVNIHCIFNPNFDSELENNFFWAIKCSAWSWSKPMNKQWLIDLWKSLDGSLNNDLAYKKWVDNFVVTSDSLQELYDNNKQFRDNVIITVSNSSNDGASWFQKHYDLFEDIEPWSLDGVRRAIYCISDSIFSWNPEDKKYFLGEKKDQPDTVREKCGSLKPCIHWSDAHTEDKLFLPDQNRNCWIKSEVTFEWLKQIIYEPSDRIIIQETIPEEKEDYQIIDRVQFMDDWFMQEEICIHQNLTTIIGGKSTWKSLLLRNIAQAIDPEEVNKRLTEVGLASYPEEVWWFKVIWRDWQESVKGLVDGVNKKIIYIPQSYLNRLVDIKEDQNSIDDIIKTVLEQEDIVKEVFEVLQTKGREIERRLTQNIEDLFYKSDDIWSAKVRIKTIGDKKGIDSEVKKLSKEVADLKTKAWMTDEEIQEYNKLRDTIKKLHEDKEELTSQLALLNVLLEEENFFTYEETDDLIEKLSPEIQDILSLSVKEILEQSEYKLSEKVRHQIWIINKSLKDSDAKLVSENKNFQPLIEKAKKSKSLNDKIQRLEKEQVKLKEIIKHEKLLEALYHDYEQLIKRISSVHAEFYTSYFEGKAEILKQKSITVENDLEFGINVTFQSNAFQEWINEMSDQRQLGKVKELELQEYSFESNIELKNDLEKIIRLILSDTLTLKSSYSKKEAITKIVRNWFLFDYKISQNGDEISEMSPWKKSFVLLKLLIELDNSECPILLDQPEDDLDNRSIYYDLVKFIKNKKKSRQIIIATHNPNLVVGADSELVIVSNQDWDETKNKEYHFEYIQGALENTFEDNAVPEVLYKQWVREHVCDVLEWGQIAFEHRQNKYNFK